MAVFKGTITEAIDAGRSKSLGVAAGMAVDVTGHGIRIRHGVRVDAAGEIIGQDGPTIYATIDDYQRRADECSARIAELQAERDAASAMIQKILAMQQE